jgi:hypothetical protein
MTTRTNGTDQMTMDTGADMYSRITESTNTSMAEITAATADCVSLLTFIFDDGCVVCLCLLLLSLLRLEVLQVNGQNVVLEERPPIVSKTFLPTSVLVQIHVIVIVNVWHDT